MTQIKHILIASLVMLCGAYGVLNFLTDSWIMFIVSDTNRVPQEISAHTTVLNQVNNTLIIFGGHNSKVVSSNLTRYDIVGDSWMPSFNHSAANIGPSPLSAIPSGRYGHVAVTTTLNAMYIYGGRNINTTFGDIYKYDMLSDLWIPINVTGDIPAGRHGHSGVTYSQDDLFYFFGGILANGTITNSVLIFNYKTNTWMGELTIGALQLAPTPRFAHTAIMTATNEMVVFGGVTGYGSNPTYTSNTMHFLDVEKNEWIDIPLNTTSGSPSPLSGHAAVFTPLNTMLVFGGRSASNSTNANTWKYDFVYNRWDAVMPSGLGPVARFAHTCTMTLFNTMIVFGGQSNGASSFHNDISKYNVVNSVLRSSTDGVTLVVLLSLVGTLIIGLCFALDLMAEKNEQDRLEKMEAAAAAAAPVSGSGAGASRSDGAELQELNKKKKDQKQERQPLFEKF
eukprot:gene17724-21134_t